MKIQVVLGEPNALGSNSSRYLPVFSGNWRADTAEAELQTYWKDSGSFSDLYARVDANDVAIGYNLVFRKNSASQTDLQVTIPASTTGVFSDNVDSVSVIGMDLINLYASVPNSGTQTNFTAISLVFQPDGSSVSYKHGNTNISTHNTTGSTYYAINQALLEQAVEAGTQYTAQFAFDASYAHAYVYANTGAAMDIILRKNSADTSLAMSVGASATGAFSDTTDTVSFAVNDEINWMVSSAGTPNANIGLLDVQITNSVNNKFVLMSQDGSGNTFSTTTYSSIVGDCNDLPTASEVYTPIGMDFLASNMTIYSTSNAHTSTFDFITYINDSTGNQSVSVPSTTTGTFTDPTGSDSLVQGDLIAYRATPGGTGTFYMHNISLVGTTSSGTSFSIENVNVYKTGMKIFD